MKFIKLNNGHRINLDQIQSYHVNIGRCEVVFIPAYDHDNDGFEYREEFETEEQANERLKELDSFCFSDDSHESHYLESLSKLDEKLCKIKIYCESIKDSSWTTYPEVINMMDGILNIIGKGE